MKFLLSSAALLSAVVATSITKCHFHDSKYMCTNTAGVEGSVSPAPTGTSIASYTSCHLHGTVTYCMNSNSEVRFYAQTTTSTSASSASSSASSSSEASITTSASSTSSASSATSATASGQTTAITDCHAHGTVYYCVDGFGNEGSVTPAPSGTPASLTACHAHAAETYCMDASNKEYQFVVEEATTSSSSDDEEMDCHFHAGVEHCVTKSGSSDSASCERKDRDYNIKLRVGLLFAVLAMGLGCALFPILVRSVSNVSLDGYVFVLLKQFGTGVIISTALVHLLTHAFLMFDSECLTLEYEGAVAAIAMAGIFISFLLDFCFKRLIESRMKVVKPDTSDDDAKSSLTSEASESLQSKRDKISVFLLEAGIVFHSILIGLTLVVAGDSYFITLFIVILFHQGFEGLAIGSRIAELDTVKLWIKLAMGILFAITTPLGMAIGIGVLNTFNGNDPSTIIALGTLDSLSAGILLWVGLVQMMAHDFFEGKLLHAGWLKVAVAVFGLMAGMALMSFLGKWA